ncbi:hypothetical protein [Chryseobacterium sp. MEBOG07]|nr:hypothetical protein [Chryseobacterium sp. MEBOG07]UKB78465.1 hypothetical protein LF886_18600 [Chryseobacterium sp. MEBOG07]
MENEKINIVIKGALSGDIVFSMKQNRSLAIFLKMTCRFPGSQTGKNE